MKFVDLFCGMGGSSYGALQAGLEPHLLVDNIAEMQSVLSEELKPFFIQSDLTRLDAAIFEKMIGAQVLLCSPPCQNFSRLKHRNRSVVINESDRLFTKTIIQVLKSLKPRLVIIENVPAFLKTDMAAKLVAGIEHVGLNVEAKVLDAAHFGVPQRRKRAIIIGSTHASINLNSQQATSTVRDAFDGLPILNGPDILHSFRKKMTDLVLERIQHIPPNGGSRISLPAHLQLKCHKGLSGFRDVYGRMAWDLVSPTITSGCTNPSKGRFIHPEEHRSITFREAARLQTLPDQVTLQHVKSNEARSRLIGNAFPSNFIQTLLELNL